MFPPRQAKKQGSVVPRPNLSLNPGSVVNYNYVNSVALSSDALGSTTSI